MSSFLNNSVLQLPVVPPTSLTVMAGVSRTPSWNRKEFAIRQLGGTAILRPYLRFGAILAQTKKSRPALSSACGLCHWQSSCKEVLEKAGDLTLIAELGRASRDKISGVIPTIQAFADSNPDTFVQGKKTVFSGIGPDTLHKFHSRAQLLSTPGATAYLKERVDFPINQKEVFFDIEADPMRGVVYLHGFVEREYARPETATVHSPFCRRD